MSAMVDSAMCVLLLVTWSSGLFGGLVTTSLFPFRLAVPFGESTTVNFSLLKRAADGSPRSTILLYFPLFFYQFSVLQSNCAFVALDNGR
jgi:hypothetical protein